MLKILRKSFLILFFALFIVGTTVWNVYQPVTAWAQTDSGDHLSVTFIIDNSGSMETSDPQDLRLTAVKLFISLLDQGDGASIITFSTNSTIKAHFLSIRNRDDKINLMNSLQDVNANGFTDMKAAFTDALAALGEDKTGNQKIIIFLTDGFPQLPTSMPGGYDDDVLSLVKQTNVPVIGIGLTNMGLSPLLGRIPSYGVEGSRIIPAKTASDLLDVYLGILGQLKDRTVIGTGTVTIPSPASLAIDPALAQYVESVSFVAVKSTSAGAEVVTPNGQRLSAGDPLFNETFTDLDPNFAVYTMPSPVGGNWQMGFNGSGTAQARAILRSKLRIQILQPGYFTPLGEPMPIAASLLILNPPNPPQVSIGDVTFSVLVIKPDGKQEVLDLLYDDGSHGDSKAGDGKFTNIYVNTDLPGTYRFTVRGSKGVVPVTGQAQVEAIAFPKIQIDAPDQPQMRLKNQLHVQAHLIGADPAELDQGNLILTVTRPDGKIEAPITLIQDGTNYSYDYQPPVDGTYQLEISATDATYRGMLYEDKASTTVNVKLIPTITIAPECAPTCQGFDLGKLLSLGDGQTMVVHILSTSQDEETVQVSIAGIPSGIITPNELKLSPGADQKISLTLKSTANLIPGSISGRILFNSPTNAELPIKEIPVMIEAVRANIQLDPAEINLNNVFYFGTDQTVNLMAKSDSPFQHAITIASVEPVGFSARVDPETILPKGPTPLKLHILTSSEVAPGDYVILVKFSPPSQQVVVTPETVTIRLHVPNFIEIYGPYAGILFAFALLAAIVVYFLIPSPRGRLVAQKFPGTKKPGPFYLSKLTSFWRKGYNKQVTLGKDAKNDIFLQDGSVLTQHATFRGERRELTKVIGKGKTQRKIKYKQIVTVIYPRKGAAVKHNNSLVPPGGIILKPDDTIEIGTYTFLFL